MNVLQSTWRDPRDAIYATQSNAGQCQSMHGMAKQREAVQINAKQRKAIQLKVMQEPERYWGVPVCIFLCSNPTALTRMRNGEHEPPPGPSQEWRSGTLLMFLS